MPSATIVGLQWGDEGKGKILDALGGEADVVVRYQGGGNAGHNGLKSVSAHIGNDYTRVRIGVGHPGNPAQVSNHVLNDFAKADAVWLEPLLEEMSKAAARLAAGDPARFLNDIAGALNPGQDAKPNAKNKVPPVKPTQRAPNKKQDNQPRTGLAENLQKWLKGSGNN